MMHRLPQTLATLLAVAILSNSVLGEDKKSDKADKKPATVKVEIKDLTLNIPKSWQQQPPGNPLRLTQFEIPTVEGDKEKPLLVVSSFNGDGGGLEKNIQRWKSEFRGKIKMTLGKGESPQGKYVFAELTGTHAGPPFKPRKTPLENGSVVTLIVMPKGKPYYYLKVTGPGKSVAAAAKALRTAIGADPKAEKKIEEEKK